MKKLILLLVSGILILSLSGSAFADPAGSDLQYSDGTPISMITLPPGSSITVNYQISGLLPGAENDVWTYDSPIVNLVPPIQPGATINDILVEFPKGASFTPVSVPQDPNVVGSDPYVHVGGIKVTNVNAVEGQQYELEISSQSSGQTANVDKAKLYEQVGVPEFPTVALPVAAILGLVFVFGRKKEGL